MIPRWALVSAHLLGLPMYYIGAAVDHLANLMPVRR
jgi:hypothetical protein